MAQSFHGAVVAQVRKLAEASQRRWMRTIFSAR